MKFTRQVEEEEEEAAVFLIGGAGEKRAAFSGLRFPTSFFLFVF